jgi:hypothetical protein
MLALGKAKKGSWKLDLSGTAWAHSSVRLCFGVEEKNMQI